MHAFLLLVLTITLTINSSLTCSNKSLQAYKLMRDNNQGYKDILFSTLANNQATVESIQEQFLVGKDAKTMENLVKDPYTQSMIMDTIIQNPKTLGLCQELYTCETQLTELRSAKNTLDARRKIRAKRDEYSHSLVSIATETMLNSLESISLILTALTSYPEIVQQSSQRFLKQVSPSLRDTIASQFTQAKMQRIFIPKISQDKDIQALCNKIKQLKQEKKYQQSEEAYKGYEQTLAWSSTDVLVRTMSYKELLKPARRPVHVFANY